ncbi:hypothetical protein KBC03_07760 [Patescibacteria group bacterium]|nr:hypothetical protein [Patescibacteria group bacterium]
MKIHTITLSGVDDNTSIPGLIQLSKQFPKVEIGILLSQKNIEHGESRYPTRKYIELLCRHDKKLQLAGHICRAWMKDLFLGKTTVVDELGPDIWSSLQRIQFNYYKFFTDPTIQPMKFKDKVEGLLQAVGLPCFEGKQLIFPRSEYSAEFIDQYRGRLPAGHVIFHDSSFGQGRTPDVWPNPIGNPCGYAGKLDPDNYKKELLKIAAVVGEQGSIWTDAETGLRDPHNKFDFKKAIAMCDLAHQSCYS